MEKTRKISTMFAIALFVTLILSFIIAPIKFNHTVHAAEEDITTLVGTTWYFNTSLDGSYACSGNINFKSGNSYEDCFISLTFSQKKVKVTIYYESIDDESLYAFSSPAPDGNPWASAYRTISIMGGDDAVSTGENFVALRSFLYNNATQIDTPANLEDFPEIPEASGDPDPVEPVDPTPTPSTGIVADVILPMTFGLIVAGGLIIMMIEDKKSKKITK